MKVLVVDSSLETRKSLKECAGKCGCEIVLAKQGYEALKIIEKERFDLFLIEADLKGLNGYEICRKIKDNTSLRNVPVVLLVNDNSKENKIRGYQVDVDGFLAKPIFAKELKALLSYFSKRKSKIKNSELCSEVAKSISEILNSLLGEKETNSAINFYYNRLTNFLELENCTSERLKITNLLYSKKWLIKVVEENRIKALSNLKMGEWLVPLLKYLYGYKNKYSKKEKLILAGIDFTIEADILIITQAFFELKSEGLNNSEAIKVLRNESEKMGYNENVLDKLEEIGKTEDLLISLQV